MALVGVDIPDPIRPFIDLGFDFNKGRMSGKNAFADCIFCGGRHKLYINIDNQQWDCKLCGLKGNVYTFMKEWYTLWLKRRDEDHDETAWVNLANDRQIAPDVLKKAGVVYDGLHYAIPVKNTSGTIVNIVQHELGGKAKGLSTIEANIFGAEEVTLAINKNARVFLVEGPYDRIALNYLLQKYNQKGIVLGVPGSGMWKKQWTEYIKDRHVIVAYDNDTAGIKGIDRVNYFNGRMVASMSYIAWPTELPEGFDIRDFVTKDGTYKQLASLIRGYTPEQEREDAKIEDDKVPINSRQRPKFSKVVAVYRRHMHMSQDLEDALKVIFAVVLSLRIKGDPLWIHLVGPPGSGKTMTLLSVSGCSSCYIVSTLTPHSLISGFNMPNGQDPSLLPKLDGKVLVCKDYTEILAMNRTQKDELFGTLRGAYDGEASKPFGNSKGTVSYKSRFNMITGVTQQIYAERSASLGERFLMFHIIKGVGFDSEKEIRSAIDNVNKEVKIREEITDIASRFLNVTIEDEQIPEIPEWIKDKMVSLAQLVAMLRASVERDFRGERKLLYRPQHEVGTRLAKQFSKLLLGLGLTNSPPSVGDDEYRILTRVAVDSMVGFNLEAIASLIEKPEQDMKELSADCNLAVSTLADQVDDLIELGAIKVKKKLNTSSATGQGRPMSVYSPTPRLVELWNGAGLIRVNGEVKSIAREKRVRLKIKTVRRLIRSS